MEKGVSGSQLETTRALRGLIEVTRLTRASGDLSARLERLAGVMGESLGFGTVVITLYRPEWDDYRVAAVSGREEARRALLGRTRSHADYDALLDERFRRGGGYLILHGEFDWTGMAPAYTPPGDPVDDDASAWHPEDALIVPLRSTHGGRLGMISVDEPVSRRRPTDDAIDQLVSVSEHVALAIEEAQASAVRERYQAALRQLLQVSSRLTETLSVDSILHEVCDAISHALGFEKVSIELLGSRGNFVTRASAGWGADGPPYTALTPDTLAPLLDPDYEIEGCFLLPLEVAQERVPERSQVYESSLNGAGPHAWNRHWLLVPMYDRDGSLEGFIWADDPVDRLLPPREKLQALRLFANQATTALDSAKRFAEMQFLADHDPLTRLGNRRAFVADLESETARSARYGNAFTLVLCDLDEFKSVNDRSGHLAGDDFLVEFAERLTTSIRRADKAYRIGGDEFALILVEASEEEARIVVERIAEVTNQPGAVRASFGLAVYEANEPHDELFRRADEAMYRAKRSGDEAVVVSA